MWNISNAFKAQYDKPVQEARSRIEILDTDFQRVRVIGGGGLDKGLVDGTVDVDVTRGTRRTLVLSLLNENGEFSPTSDWGGLFYVDRLVRVFRGLVVGGSPESPTVEYVPVGTFLVDKSETLVERQMSTVVLAGSDLWKKFSKSQFVKQRTFDKGRSINGIIRDLADEAGVTKLNLDPLDGRTSNSKDLQTRVNFEKGETRGDALKKICEDHGIDVYFDPLGRLVTEDVKDPESQAVVWKFGYADDAPKAAYYIRSLTDDDRLYNHVHVTGTGDEEHTYYANKKDTDPRSPTNIDRIGDRVLRFESGVLASQEAVDKAANRMFHRNSLISHTIALETICMPAFEGNDVVKVIEPHYVNVSARFTLSNFNIPLLTSKQKITMKRVINVGD